MHVPARACVNVYICGTAKLRVCMDKACELINNIMKITLKYGRPTIIKKHFLFLRSKKL